MMQTWFAKALKEALEAGGLTQEDLANTLGEKQSQISRWLKGSLPKPERQEELLSKLGGDMSRAMPSWKPSKEQREGGHQPPAAVMAGKVIGADGRIEWLSEERRPASALSVAGAIDPERWALGQGPALLLRLGDRLGDWPAGSTVVARAWREGARPPQGLFAAAARSDAWGPGESGWRLRRLLWSDQGGAPRYAAMSLDPLRADADALPADRLQLGAIACGVILPV